MSVHLLPDPDSGGGSAPSLDRDAIQARCDERIGVLSAQIHALEAELVGVLAEHLDADGGTGRGFRSTAHWLSVRSKFTMSDARRLVGVAERAVVVAPLLEDGRAGQLSLGVIATAARVAHAGNIERLRGILATCTPSQSARVLATYRTVRPTPTPDVDSGGEERSPEFEEPGAADGLQREFWWRRWCDEQGRYRADIALDAATGALLEQARAATEAALRKSRAQAEPVTNDETPDDETPDDDVDAGPYQPPKGPSIDEVIAELAGTVIDGADRDGVRMRGGDRFHVAVTCDLATLAAALRIPLDPTIPVGFGSRAYVPSTGAHLSNTELAAIVSDAGVQLLVENDGEPLWLGATQRLFNRHQRRALANRASHQCEAPGCTNTAYIDVHHMIEAGRDGPTDLDNGLYICTRCHRDIHRRGLTIRRQLGGLALFDGAKCLGPIGAPNGRGRPPDIAQLPLVDNLPTMPDGITTDTPRSTGGGEPLTAWGLDVLLHHLLAA